jgi:hypothetical protein
MADNGNPPDPPNTLKDAQNILGFLLAGFAGVLSFLGLRSDEVTTVLRNDTRQATLVAFILFLSVLAAAIGVAIPGTHKVSWLRMTGAFLVLLAAGALVIYKIPVQVTTAPQKTKESLYDSYVLAAIGVVAFLVSIWVPKSRTIYTQFVFIVASITLLAASIYGAMRLETDSQLNSVVQISANVAKDTSETTLSVHVTASKIREVGYIGINVMALPSGVPFMELCSTVMVPKDSASCTEDPCAYLKKCVVIFGATVPPDPSGDVDETLSDALITGQYQDITVKASVCQTQKGCSSLGSLGSRVDLHLTNPPPES